jgi:hypothetical protein
LTRRRSSVKRVALAGQSWFDPLAKRNEKRYHLRLGNESLRNESTAGIVVFIGPRAGSRSRGDGFALNREKIVFPNSKAIVFIGPLKPGRYEFVGEFNQKTARGVVIAE